MLLTWLTEAPSIITDYFMPAWMNIYIHYILLGKFAYLFCIVVLWVWLMRPRFSMDASNLRMLEETNGVAVEGLEWMRNFITHFAGHVITYDYLTQVYKDPSKLIKLIHVYNDPLPPSATPHPNTFTYTHTHTHSHTRTYTHACICTLTLYHIWQTNIYILRFFEGRTKEYME